MKFTSLQEVVTVSADLLKTNGRLAMVHRPDRFLDIYAMENANIAPKKLGLFIRKSQAKKPMFY